MLTLFLSAALAQALPPLVSANEVSLVETTQPPYPRDLRGLGVRTTCQTTLTFDTSGVVTDVQIGGCDDPFLTEARNSLFAWKAEPLLRYGQPSQFRLRVVIEFLDPNASKNAQGNLVDVPVDQVVWKKKKPVPPIPGAPAGTCTVDTIIDRSGKVRLVTVSGCSTEVAQAVETTLFKWRASPMQANGRSVVFRTRFGVEIKAR